MQKMEGEVEATPDLLAGLFGPDGGDVFNSLLVLMAEDDEQVDNQ